jgi:hypothetical protein
MTTSLTNGILNLKIFLKFMRPGRWGPQYVVAVN